MKISISMFLFEAGLSATIELGMCFSINCMDLTLQALLSFGNVLSQKKSFLEAKMTVFCMQHETFAFT